MSLPASHSLPLLLASRSPQPSHEGRRGPALAGDEIPLKDVNKKLIHGLTGREMARFKFRKGCLTIYGGCLTIYAYAIR
ncbi:hypothetical protein GUJ93_ZPchr0012g22056 [Zizania palustris]|uniref:DUF7851 domain-containing protein n=1 Tax=Zizania palustris TaxID=103762 RepID=A0A8J6BV27_ZIZPA|nr:hypothetical protein GUJ93_ZPchr0012g22056 [Zizania palustris]